MSKQEFPYTSVVPNRFEDVDASSSDVTPTAGRCVGFYVGVTGNVRVTDRGGNTANFISLPVGVIVPGEFVTFVAAGTTSTALTALCVGSNA